ncbi:CPBP family intramembrane metalloprotease [Paenibacillus chondroitinus]|uniref:CPBP family intramembrane metalloprotease n=1 Tax=Paenibacillus chondroitinus TaxID=59842 RepID=A0ABU6DKM3_9BACL|nr:MULTISPECIES: CPBP family intramembrane glutamic endopeptidase [Paenibacillus]MCY9660402.1 CPBP family intramembrane metalloprotease [Paenibacillus anseongense]MEB4798329.1 CPBP family intramembrane metalloprotease [Paenibacillus chondroitinus]
MLGIIVILLLSWLLLRFTIRQQLSVLGYNPIGLRLRQFGIALLIGLFVCVVVKWTESVVTSAGWEINSGYQWSEFFSASWWSLKSVWFEELLFRGALLVILIRWLGVRLGIVLSAAAFGAYHWFSYGLFGNIPVMILMFAATFVMGLVWAYAYSKSGSMAIAAGSHLGWNAASAIIFSDGPIGDQLLIPLKGAEYVPLTGLPSLLFFIASNTALPFILFFWIKYKKST